MKHDENKSEEELLLNGVPCTAESGATSGIPRRRWKWAMAASVLCGVLFFTPARAHAGIFDVFGELFGTIQSDIGGSLKVDQSDYATGSATLPDNHVAIGRAQSGPRLCCEFDFQFPQSDEPGIQYALFERGYTGSATVRVDSA